MPKRKTRLFIPATKRISGGNRVAKRTRIGAARIEPGPPPPVDLDEQVRRAQPGRRGEHRIHALRAFEHALAALAQNPQTELRGLGR